MDTSPASPPVRAGELAAAVRDLLRTRRPDCGGPVIAGDAVLVPGRSPRSAAISVVAALDDDANPGRVLGFAAVEAVRRGVPLRAVHVCTRLGRPSERARRLGHDRMMTDADHLLSQVLYDHLPADRADAAEREILYDDEPVRALIDLSRTSSLLVLAARGSGGAAAIGSTVRGLIGRTYCPLVVLTPAAPAAPGAPPGW
ncbi:universal stress protein [Nucisporomicrobium flavum]|jgi:Universal stress protein family|uniref:universal stress protein n=1 Tax=Nucisporomicrobium flavum TaxID=2785915 RepID=UPI0018F5EEC8|nr:universal stress protein [Nucisporomicrobium flavum]